MNPNNITQKEIYSGVALALSKFSDEFANNTASLRVDATLVGGGDATAANQVIANAILTDIEANQTNQTQNVNIYGSDDGGVTKRIVKTDAGGAIQVDLEVASVTVTNGAGAAAVNIQDGGNSITVDGTVTITPSGTQNINLTQVLGAAPSATNPVPARATDGTAFLANLGETQATGQFVRLTDGTDLALVTAAGQLNVISVAQPGVDIGDVDVLSVIPGTGATNLGKAEDAAHASGDVGVMALGVRNDTRATTYGANGDYTPIAVDSTGATFVNGTNSTGAQTITSSSVTDDNTIAAGSTSLGFTTSSDFSGNINGVARNPSTFYGFEAAVGRTLPAVTYTTTTGSIIIDQII